MKIFSIMLFLLVPYAVNHKAVSMNTKSDIVFEQLEFSPDNLKKYLKFKKIKHPEVVYAQALLESANFTSRIFKENHNLDGMKYVDTLECKKRGIKYRPTVAIGKQHGHARYKSWQSCIDDYALWQSIFKRTPMTTQEEYLKLLARHGYAEDKRYVPVLRVIMKQNKF